jgi:hypothetical protein
MTRATISPQWDLACWRLAQVFEWRGYRKLRARLASLNLPNDDELALAAILAVEMTARSHVMRAAEWFVWSVGRVLHLPSQCLPRSIGPFQLQDSPFKFERAALRAAGRLDWSGGLATMAITWNGQGRSLRGFEYSDLVEVAWRRVNRDAHPWLTELPT